MTIQQVVVTRESAAIGLCGIRSVLVIAIAIAFIVQMPPSEAADDDTGWDETVLMTGQKYQNVDVEIAKRHVYVLTWEYYDGPVVFLQRSDSWGRNWSEPSDVLGSGVLNAFPAMCVYTNGSEDEVIVASGPDIVTRSQDGGESFSALSALPVPDGCAWWCYMAVGTNASWFGGLVDSDIYVVGSLYVGEPWTGRHVLAFTKSTDWGATWSEPTFICGDEERQTNYPELVSDGSKLYVAYSKINISGIGSEIDLKWSDNWGANWSSEVPIPLSRTLGVGPTGFQYLDEEKAVFTCAGNAYDPLDCFGRIGYFYFSNLTYQVTCELSGEQWCMAAGSFAGHLSNDGTYHVVWAHEPVLNQPMSLMYACSKDSGIAPHDLRTPLVMGDPHGVAGPDSTYECELHGTDADSGVVDWEMHSNAAWLSEEETDDGACVVSGMPSANGQFWVNVTVSDDDSTDYFNWTVSTQGVVPGVDDSDDDEAAGDGPDGIYTVIGAAAVVAVAVALAVALLMRRGKLEKK